MPFRPQPSFTGISLLGAHLAFALICGLERPLDVFSETMHLPLDDVVIAMRPREHDRTFDHADDVPSHLFGVQIFCVVIGRQTATDRSLVQVNPKLLGHLIKTLSQPLAKRGMRITERCAEITSAALMISSTFVS
jgi:hypothetical protein